MLREGDEHQIGLVRKSLGNCTARRLRSCPLTLGKVEPAIAAAAISVRSIYIVPSTAGEGRFVAHRSHGWVRAKLLAELERYAPADARERAMAERLRAFVAEHADCFERSLAIGHVTGSAWVVDRDREAALLTHHRKLGRWLQLGGHADGDGDIRRVALREAREESGIADIVLAQDAIYDVDVHDIPARGAEAAHVHYDVRFAFFAPRSAVPVLSAESHEIAWVPLAELERYGVDGSVLRLRAKTGSLAVV